MKEMDNMPAPRTGIQGLESAFDGSIDYRSWHTTSAALELVASNLSHRSLEELLGAIDQLEKIIPELSAEKGVAEDALELEPVGPVKKIAAIVFSKYFVELKGIVRRAELREEAEIRLKILNKVSSQLSDLRGRLTQKVDKLVFLRLKDNNPALYEEHKAIEEREGVVRSNWERLTSLQIERLDTIHVSWRVLNIGDARKEPSVANYIAFYEEITGNRLSNSMVFSKEDLKGRLKAVGSQINEELKRLASSKEVLLEQARRA